MNRLCYRPKAVVEYSRRAYIAKENKIRVTIDSEITGSEADFDIFSERLPLYPALDPYNSVLEVKYNGFLLGYIKNTVSAVNCSEMSVRAKRSRAICCALTALLRRILRPPET